MRKLLLTLAVLCGTVSGWGATPTESFKASTILPSLGIPEHQYYVRGTYNNKYWTSTTDDTDAIANAGKFALYAVPGLQDCYYIYSITDKKWLSYPNDNRNNRHDFIQSADNFDANAYWKITGVANKECYQMQPTKLDKDYDGETRIQENRFANWFEGPGKCTSIGLWETGASGDDGSCWSFISVDVTENLDVILSQSLAVANEILATQLSYTKGEGILTSSNVSQIFSSPHSDSAEGVIANLVDNNASTCWHSNWHDGATFGGSHYFEINLDEITPELLSFSYSRRTAADNDHTVRWAVYGVPADETGIKNDSRNGLTFLAWLSTPWGNKNQVFNNLPPFKTQGFKKFRIYSEATEQNRGYFHIGELQLNANTIAESNTDDIKALVAAVAEAEALETVTQQDIAALNEKIAPFVLTEEQKSLAQDLLNLTGIGYPTPNSAARIALQNFLDNPASLREDFEPAIAAYKTSTEVNIPISGRAYQFAFVANNADKTEYKLTANGTTLTASNDAVASTFYCVEYTSVDGHKRFAFISEEGKFLGYHALTDSYMTHVGADKRLQNDISFSAMTSYSTGNITSSAEDRFGTVAMKVDNRVLSEPDKDGCFILKWSAKSLDKSSAPYHNGTYTSAIKVTEVAEYTPTNAAMIAASTIAPLVHGYIRIGEGIGKYSYTFGEHSGDVFTDFEELVKATSKELTSADYSFAIHMPTAGFYYIKSMNANDNNKKNKYWQVNEAGTQMELALSKDEKRSIIYVGNDYKLVGYGCGSYLNHYNRISTITSNTDSLSTAEIEGGSWGVVENQQVVGTYALDLPTENWFLSDWTGGATYGNNDANAAWTFEPVDSLPIKITSAGYATFYCPVAVTLPDSLNAYYVSSTTNDKAQMAEITEVIPANTGVILQGAEGSYNLTIGGEATAVENILKGSVADTYINSESYVLSKQDDKVGFYKTKLNFSYVAEKGKMTKTAESETGTHFLNNGFKAYLPKPAGSNSRFFVFDFGGSETGIDELKGENGNVKAEVYDLAGRRVLNAKKGVFVVNGKVIVK